MPDANLTPFTLRSWLERIYRSAWSRAAYSSPFGLRDRSCSFAALILFGRQVPRDAPATFHAAFLSILLPMNLSRVCRDWW